MSITAETAKQHAHDPAVLCCRAEEGITIGPENLEDPAIFDELVESGLLNLDGCLQIHQILGAKLIKTCDSLTPVTADVIDAVVEGADEGEEPEKEEEEQAAPAPEVSVEGARVTAGVGKLVISIKEGKDIYLEIPF